MLTILLTNVCPLALLALTATTVVECATVHALSTSPSMLIHILICAHTHVQTTAMVVRSASNA